MGAPLEFCAKKSVVAVLASGVVISLAALTGGIAPAFAKPDTDPVAPTTVVPPEPEPEVEAPAETAEPEVPAPEAPPKKPEPLPEPPIVEAPPPTQEPIETPPIVEEPPPTQEPIEQPTTESVVAPTRAVAPTTAVNPPVTSAAPPAAREAAPESSEASAASSSPSTPTSGTAPAESESETADTSAVSPSSSSTLSQAAQVIEDAEPETLQAPEQDVQLAKSSKPIEQKVIPAAKRDIDALSNAIFLPDRNRDRRIDDIRRDDGFFPDADRRWDRKVRQWNRDWVEYDEFYRPVFFNPYRDAVRIVYVYQNLQRIVFLPPLARIVLQVAEFAAYSFTAVVLNPINTAVSVAVGTFFGGGYVPGIGLPLPPPPRPVLRYDNVPVLVRYSQAVYEPFRVRRIIDVGDDARFGERKVLLDGATPAWGVWTQTPSGERQFEVHRTQQFPGLDDPQEGPLPGDYQLRLAADESPGLDRKDILLFTAAGVVAALGFGAIGLAVLIGRRRPEH